MFRLRTESRRRSVELDDRLSVSTIRFDCVYFGQDQSKQKQMSLAIWRGGPSFKRFAILETVKMDPFREHDDSYIHDDPYPMSIVPVGPNLDWLSSAAASMTRLQ